MKKFFFVLLVITMSSALYAQIPFLSVTSENISVTGAVFSELMLELKINAGLSTSFSLADGDSFFVFSTREKASYSRAAGYCISIIFHNYYVNSMIIFDLLKTKDYWIKNLKLEWIGGSLNEIQVIYTLNGKSYPAIISVTFPG